MQGGNSSTDRRYQVFISSTFQDLQEERKGAIEAVFERGHIPIALERFSPANDSDLQVIKKAMADSQVYVLILGHRYGEIIPEKNISFTELEYDLAQEYGLFTLVFLMEKSVINEKRKTLDPNNVKDKNELSNYDRLMTFHTKIANHFRKIFIPGPEFKYLVQLALADGLCVWNKPGFVREPIDLTVIEGVKNEFISDIVYELRSFKKLYIRLELQAEKKRGAAKFFVERYMDRLVDKKVSLFLESGSTICFLAKEMAGALKKNVILSDDGSPNIQISTNNVLAYLLLWLNARIPCTKFPWSPPVETTYGAAYGGLENLVELSPDYSLPPLDANAWREVDRLLKTPFTLTSMKRPTLLCGAASGLQLTADHKFKFTEPALLDIRKKELQEQLDKCYGPHVGSYHNKVFKRFMYATKIPIVIFITGDKIDSEIEVGKCHFILDRKLDWEYFIREHPLAFCVGCENGEKRRYVEMFQKLGFEVIEQNNASTISSFIARNAVFISEFEIALGIA